MIHRNYKATSNHIFIAQISAHNLQKQKGPKGRFNEWGNFDIKFLDEWFLNVWYGFFELTWNHKTKPIKLIKNIKNWIKNSQDSILIKKNYAALCSGWWFICAFII